MPDALGVGDHVDGDDPPAGDREGEDGAQVPARHPRRAGSLGEALLAFGLCIVCGFAFVWLFIYMGLLTGNPQGAQGMSMLAYPMIFISSAYVPVDALPAAMSAVAEHQPVTVMCNAVRALALGDAGARLRVGSSALRRYDRVARLRQLADPLGAVVRVARDGVGPRSDRLGTPQCIDPSDGVDAVRAGLGARGTDEEPTRPWIAAEGVPEAVDAHTIEVDDCADRHIGLGGRWCVVGHGDLSGLPQRARRLAPRDDRADQFRCGWGGRGGQVVGGADAGPGCPGHKGADGQHHGAKAAHYTCVRFHATPLSTWWTTTSVATDETQEWFERRAKNAPSPGSGRPRRRRRRRRDKHDQRERQSQHGVDGSEDDPGR
ncbi:hypothetical protein E1269_13290 [Jiangella asiatica]|uniref:ABC-2 type transporter transmembrane domain-containing protein n=1 Tax=Jiangella asiatica TaxID=2530372 RepID=A0A4V2Z2S9_9ACTN|nr:hypothetical protein E1269_13290 [Jiangella asiatica]